MIAKIEELTKYYVENCSMCSEKTLLNLSYNSINKLFDLIINGKDVVILEDDEEGGLYISLAYYYLNLNVKDTNEIVDYIIKAAKKGHPIAMETLYRLYPLKGITRATEIAKEYYLSEITKKKKIWLY